MKYKTILPLLTALSTLNTHAQLIHTFSGGDPLSLGPGVAAYEFALSAPLTLTAFGLFDEDADAVLNSAHAIGLWNADTGALLARITVAPATATLTDGYFWANLIVPISLQAGTPYRIGAQYADVDLDLARGNVPPASVVTDSRVVLRDAYLSSGSGFDFPDLNVAGANAGFFGANAMIAVPESAHAAMVAALALVALLAVRRKRLLPLALLACAAPLAANEIYPIPFRPTRAKLAALRAANPGATNVIRVEGGFVRTVSVYRNGVLLTTLTNYPVEPLNFRVTK